MAFKNDPPMCLDFASTARCAPTRSASNSPIRRKISVSLKWSKRVGSKGDVVAGRGFPDVVGADAVKKGESIAMNHSYAVHVAPPSDDDHAALRTFSAPNVRSLVSAWDTTRGWGGVSPR